MKNPLLTPAFAGLLAIMLVPILAYAQTSELEEIIVTARKKEESLMDVPISVSVVSGSVVQDGNIGKLENLAPTLPNFHHSEAVSGNDQVFMRGVGSGSQLRLRELGRTGLRRHILRPRPLRARAVHGSRPHRGPQGPAGGADRQEYDGRGPSTSPAQGRPKNSRLTSRRRGSLRATTDRPSRAQSRDP